MFDSPITTSRTDQEKWQAVANLDLRSVRERFTYKKGWWWRLGHDPAQTEKEYRQFLYLIISHPDQTVVPWSQDLDDFWHQHILDTHKYATDCKWILGNLIHHNPHLPHGTPQHADAAHATEKMYRAAFGAKAKRRYRVSGDPGCSADMHVVFCAAHSSHGSSHHGHHDAGGHGVGGHDAGGHGHGHGCGGHGGGHGCGGHGCGGHGGH